MMAWRRNSVMMVLLVVSLPLLVTAVVVDPKQLVVPTVQQLRWQDYEIGTLIHFGPATWLNRDVDRPEWFDLESFNPTQLNADQWVDAAEAMGAKYIMLVAKHRGGFCLWQTETSDYGVRNTPWREGRGDVVGELAIACVRKDMALGIVLSPTDASHGAGAGGRCATSEQQDRYDRVYRQQLTELLSRYGAIAEIWFDAKLAIPVSDILRDHAPQAMVLQGPHATLRWVGNALGIAPYPAWNVVSLDSARNRKARAHQGDPRGKAWLPSECIVRLRNHWYWKQGQDSPLKTLHELMEIYYHSVGHGAGLLINQAPDASGRIPAADVARGAEFGAEVARRFGTILAKTRGKGETVEVTLPTPVWVDHCIIMEDISLGERIREYVLEGRRGSKDWMEMARGTAVGHKRIERFAPHNVNRVRLRIVQSAETPVIREFALYHAAQRIETEDSEGQSIDYWKVGEWSPRLFNDGWANLILDLSPYVTEAGVYEVFLKPEEAKDRIEVRAINLEFEGKVWPEFLRPMKRSQTYSLNIDAQPSGEEGAIRLRLRLAGRGRQDTKGNILLRRVMP